MDPKLIEAIILRIKAGHSKEKIQAEMSAIGYDEEFFQSAYDQATSALEGKLVEGISPAVLSEENPYQTAPTVELPSYQNLLKEGWVLANQNIHLLVKGIITFIGTIIFSGLIAVLLITFIPNHGVNDYILKVVLLFILLIFSSLAIFACFAGMIRGLLKRKESQRYTQHFIWTYLNIVGLTLVSLYVNFVTQVGYLFFYIPGLMLNVYFAFVVYIAIDGQYKGVSALTASTAMVYGRFWSIVGRVLVSVLILFLAIFTLALLSSLVVFVNPFWVPTLILFIICGIALVLFWQLCFTVSLYEFLKGVPPAKPLPVSESKLTNIYRAVIGVAIIGILIFVVLMATVLLATETKQHRFVSSVEISADATSKQELVIASQMAFQHQGEIGSFANVCEGLVLPKNALCQSSEQNFAIEIPLTWGHYCIDSSGYNEVTRRSVIESDICRKD